MANRLDSITKRVRSLHGRILLRGRRDVADAIEVGSLLEAAKPLCGREYLKWVERTCGFGYAQATRYRRLHLFAKHCKKQTLRSFATLTEAFIAAGIVREIPALAPVVRPSMPVPDPLDGSLPVGKIVCGDALTVLKSFPPRCVNCSVTSPAYWRVRNYEVVGQMGQEASVEEYVERLREVYSEIRRVISDDGVAFLNIGDCYSHGRAMTESHVSQAKSGHRFPDHGMGPYDRQVGEPGTLLNVPGRVHDALMADGGWLVRQRIVWHKTTARPFANLNRPEAAYEFVFVLAKRRDHYWNRECKHARMNVWSIPTPMDFTHRGHCASFPEELARRCIESGCPDGGIALDPFAGSGTTAVAAKNLGRRFVGVELKPEYVELARRRVAGAESDDARAG